MAPARIRAVVAIATLTIVSWLLARGASALVGALIGPAPIARAQTRVELPERDRLALGCAILERNAFDSSTGSLACDEPPPGPDRPPDLPPEDVPACEGSLRLVATYVEREGEQRVAVIHGGPGQPVVAVGTEIGARVVRAIEPTRVELADGERACTLAMFDHEVAPAVVPASAARSGSGPPLPEGVRLRGDRVEVSSRTISRAIADPMAFAGSARALPDARGLRLAGIRGDHALAGLGVRSGDLVRALDDRPLDGPDAWLGAMGAIARPGAHTLELERDGRPVRIEVDVVP